MVVPISHRKYLMILGVLFGLLWCGLAIRPWYRADWAVENILVVLFVIAVAVFHRRVRSEERRVGKECVP